MCGGSAAQRRIEGGFSMVEVLIVSVLLMMLAASGFWTIVTMSRASYRLAEDSTGLEIVQGKIEELRGTSYMPPNAPFTTNTYCATNTVPVVLNASGSNTILSGTLITSTRPITQGHAVTVSLIVGTNTQSRTIQLQTIINKVASTGS